MFIRRQVVSVHSSETPKDPKTPLTSLLVSVSQSIQRTWHTSLMEIVHTFQSFTAIRRKTSRIRSTTTSPSRLNTLMDQWNGEVIVVWMNSQRMNRDAINAGSEKHKIKANRQPNRGACCGMRKKTIQATVSKTTDIRTDGIRTRKTKNDCPPDGSGSSEGMMAKPISNTTAERAERIMGVLYVRPTLVFPSGKGGGSISFKQLPASQVLG